MKATKKSLWLSAVSMMLCAVMLLGTTFAQFTDSVTNTGNVIQAGNLKSGFYYRGLLDTTDDDYKEVSENPALFEGIGWEPGRSFGYDFKVVNEGSLAFDYEISLQNIEFAGNNNVNIADVIDVYVIGIGDTSLNGQPHNSLAYYIDKQHSVIRGGKVTTENKEHRFSIVFKMNETAGNEYQGASIDFDIVLKAKQAVWEEDGFGSSDYDKDAVYDQVNVDATGDAAANGAKLQEAINNATPGSIVFVGAGEYDAPLTVDKPLTIAGSKDTKIEDKIFVDSDGVAFENISFRFEMNSADQNAPIKTNNKDLTLENCSVERTTETAQPYGMLVDVGTGVLTAAGTTFIAPYDPETAFNASPSVIHAGEVYLDGCVIATDGYGLFSQHVTTGVIKNTRFTGIDGRPTLGCLNSTLLNGLVFDGCTFEMGYNSTVTAGNFTIKNSTFDFTNTPAGGAGNGINVYSQNGEIILENNVFKLIDGKTGINLTSASWASGGHDASKVTIRNNQFEGENITQIKVSDAWENVPSEWE